jgi:hypothetical protein
MSSEAQAALPLPDFDHLPAESLWARVSALDIQQVEQLIGYERNHGARVEVLDLLERRRDQLHDKTST